MTISAKIKGAADHWANAASHHLDTITGEHAIWFLNHGTVASTIYLPTLSTDWHIAGAADFNGDGQADLVWENTITGERAIWFLNNGVFTSSVILGFLPTAWEITEH